MPGVLPIGDFSGIALAAEIAAAGGRALPAAGLAEGVGRIDEVVGADVVIAALDASLPAEALDPLLARLREGAKGGRFAVIAIAPRGLIDLAAATLDTENVTLLVDPDAGERRGALTDALAPRATMLHDIGSEGAARGGELREEVARIARRLAVLSGADLGGLRDPSSGYAGPAREPTTAATIRTIIRARRLREQYFASDLFADPAWDMMLDLMAARLEGEEVAVSSLCIAAAVPPTTALRWIKMLTDAGLLVRRADPLDRRRVFIALSDTAAEAMERYLAALARGGIAPVV